MESHYNQSIFSLAEGTGEIESSLCLEAPIPSRFLTHQDRRISGTTQYPSPLPQSFAPIPFAT